MASESDARPRAETTSTELAQVLKPFAKGKRWLSYGEQMDSSPVQRLVVLSHAEMIRTIEAKFKHFSFVPAVVEDAFKQILDGQKDAFGLDDKHRADWCKTMSMRLRTMLRHVAQALVKESKWAQNMMRKDGGDDDHQCQSEEQPQRKQAPGAASAGEWICDWSWEHHEAWRVPVGNTKAKKEHTKDIFCDDEQDESPMRAKWPDGFIAQLPGLLQGQYKAWKIEEGCLKRGRRGKRGHNTVFECNRKVDGSVVKVAYRSEKPGSEMFGIYCPKGQLTMVLLHRFGQDDEAKIKAQAFATSLAQMFCDEPIDKAELVRRRDQGLPPETRLASKRPAASLTPLKLRSSSPAATSLASDDNPNDDDVGEVEEEEEKKEEQQPPKEVDQPREPKATTVVTPKKKANASPANCVSNTRVASVVGASRAAASKSTCGVAASSRAERFHDMSSIPTMGFDFSDEDA